MQKSSRQLDAISRKEMRAFAYINKELKLVHPLYFSIWDDQENVWKIRKWLSINPLNHRIDTWRINSFNILTGDRKLDMRLVKSVRKGLWGARFAKRLAQRVDDDNANLVQKNELEEDYLTRYISKNIYNHYMHPRVFVHKGA